MIESVRNCATPASSVGMDGLVDVFQGGVPRSRLGEQVNPEYQQLGINGVPVTGLRETHVVNQGIDDKQAGKQKYAVNTIANGEHQSGNRQQRRRKEERVLELLQRLNLRQARQAIPIKDELPKGDNSELARIFRDPTFGETSLLGGVSS